MDIAHRDPEIIPDRREFSRPQFFMDRHQLEILFSERDWNVFCCFDCVDAYYIEMMTQLVAQAGPCLCAEYCGHRISVEDRQRNGDEPVECCASIFGMRAQHAFNQLTHHGETEWIGAPTRIVGCALKLRLLEQNLGIVTGARPRIFVDPFLCDERCVAVDEFGQRRHITDRWRATENVKQSHASKYLMKFSRSLPP